jgi:GMP reductase
LNIAKNYTFYTVGTSNDDFEKLKKLQISLGNDFPKFLCIDVANGYLESFTKIIKKYRNLLPNSVIMAGNVVTSNMAEELILSGADIVKVGIGSGSVCTTRIKTGVGFPQLSAISETSFAVHGKPDGHICGDGGCTTPGDIAKAFAAGSDFVMLGGMLSGCDECQGTWEIIDGIKMLKFFGMSSEDAQEQYNGGLSSYKASEGKTVKIPHKGPVSKVLQNITGGIRSTCTYVGAKRLKDLPKCSEFIHVTKTHNTVFGVSK